MQVFSSERFVPDVIDLIGEDPFKRVPIVRLNPTTTNRLIFRNDSVALRDEIFGESSRDTERPEGQNT